MADDQELDRDQRDKEHKANDVVAADDKLAERFDHISGCRCAIGPVQKNAAGSGKIKREPTQR